MLKYWSATSLLALALLGCFVEQGVEAQEGSVLQPRLSFHPGKPSSPSDQRQHAPPGIALPLSPPGPGHLSNPATVHGSRWVLSPPYPSGPGTQKPQLNPPVHQGQNNPSIPTGPVGQQRQSSPPGQSHQHGPPGLSNPSGSQWGFNPSTTSQSHPSSRPNIGQWGMNPLSPSGPGTQKQQHTPPTVQGQSNPLKPSNRYGQSQGLSNPTVSQGHSHQHGSHGNHPGLFHWGLSSPPGSHKPTISSNPTGKPTKPSWNPKPGNPTQSQNPPGYSQKTKFGPRAHPVSQKQVPTGHDPSQKFIHLASAAKDSSEVTCDSPTNLNPQCGGKNISPGACKAMGCCYDGSRCYFAKTGEFMSPN